LRSELYFETKSDAHILDLQLSDNALIRQDICEINVPITSSYSKSSRCPIVNVVSDAFYSSLSFTAYVNLCSNIVEMLACHRQFLILNGESTPTRIRVIYRIGVGDVGSAENT